MKWKVLLIPSQLTWLLQPLDAFHFASLKRRLYMAQVHDQVTSNDGQVEFESWAKSMCSEVHHSFEVANAMPMFEGCGFRIPCREFHKKLAPHVPTTPLGLVRKLSMNELSECIGKRCDAIYSLLFHENIPAHKQLEHILVRSPAQRLRMKRSLSTLGD